MDIDNGQFSEREKEVIELLLQGKSNKQIALELHIAQSTVEYHLKNIYKKLQVSSRTEAVLRLGKTTDKDTSSEETEIPVAAESSDTAKHLSLPRITGKSRYGGSSVIVALAVIVLLSFLYLSAQSPCGPQDFTVLRVLGTPATIISHQTTDMEWQDQFVYDLALDPLNPERTLANVRQQITHIKDLGITSVLLGPVFSDQDFRKVDSRLGTEEELVRLIEEFHSTDNGPRINVILNLLLVSTGTEHEWYTDPMSYQWRYRLWNAANPSDNMAAELHPDYGPFDHTDYGPILNHTHGINTETGTYGMVRDTIFGLVDKFAFDGIKYAAADHYCAAFWPTFMRDFHQRYDQTKPDFWHIAEVFIFPKNKTWQISYTEFISQTSVAGPIAMDGAYDFALQTYIQNAVAEGSNPARLLRHLVRPDSVEEPEELVASMHRLDRSFARAVEEAGEKKNLMDRLRLASVILMTANRVPLIRSGDEYGIDTANSEALAAEADETFHEFFKELIQIRTDHSAFRRGSLTPLATTENVVSYARQHGGKAFIVVFNLDSNPKLNVDIELGALERGCSSPTNLLIESDPYIQSTGTSLFVTLKPWEPKIIQCE